MGFDGDVKTRDLNFVLYGVRSKPVTERSVPNTNKLVGVNGLLYACAGLTTHMHTHTHTHTLMGLSAVGYRKIRNTNCFNFKDSLATTQ